MIIRRSISSLQLISQPAHAALSERIISQWHADHFPHSARRPSILQAIQEHDSGWAEIDETLVLDGRTGHLVDFIEVSDALKRETSWRGIQSLSHDPYAAALVAQHRLHVYRRYAEHADWRSFFADLTAARDAHLDATVESLDQLLADYRYVRAGDLASLAFCNNWAQVDADECGYAIELDGTALVITPDPFNGRTMAIEIDAREIDHQSFTSPAAARRVVAAAPRVTLTGRVCGARARQ